MREWDGRLPHGVADLFGSDAARHIALRHQLRSVFAGWGYQEVIPPTFEYAGIQAAAASPRLQEEMYRFVDREGHTLALRADFTLAIARIVGTRLYDQPHPLRLFYVGHVFRHEEPRAGRQREFTQAGVELIGSAAPEADVEVIAIAVESLRSAGLDRFQMNIGHSGWLRGLLAQQPLSEEVIGQITLAVDRKSRAALNGILSRLPLAEGVGRALSETPTLNGSRAVLERAGRLAVSPQAEGVIQRLVDIAALLERRGLADFVAFDLGEARGLGYYTGITFEGFAPGLGVPLCSGGRYDGLLSRFGPDLPAIGFALELERLLLAVEMSHPLEPRIVPDVVAAYPPTEAAASLLSQVRRGGIWIVEDVEQCASETLIRYACERDVNEVWFWEGDGGVRIVKDGEERVLTLAELASEYAVAGRGAGVQL